MKLRFGHFLLKRQKIGQEKRSKNPENGNFELKFKWRHLRTELNLISAVQGCIFPQINKHLQETLVLESLRKHSNRFLLSNTCFYSHVQLFTLLVKSKSEENVEKKNYHRRNTTDIMETNNIESNERKYKFVALPSRNVFLCKFLL